MLENNIQIKTFSTISLQQGLSLSLMDKSAMYFNMMAFSFIKDRYEYAGGKRLKISEESIQSLQAGTYKNYDNFAVSDKRIHFERLHYRHGLDRLTRGLEPKLVRQYDRYPTVPVYVA